MASDQEPVELVGIVHPLGSGGSRNGQEKLWTLRFSLQPWKTADGQIEERALRIYKHKLTDKELKQMRSTIKPFDILRVTVCMDEEQSRIEFITAALMKAVVADSSDADLVKRAQKLQEPVRVEHDFFGTLTLNRALNWYETKFEWNGHLIDLYVHRDNDEGDESLFQSAENLWNKQDEWDRVVRDFATVELLKLKNDNWLGDDEDELTAEQFKRRMTLDAIVVYPEGLFEFSFDDGDLFWGHVIQVSGTLAEGPKHAGIAG